MQALLFSVIACALTVSMAYLASPSSIGTVTEILWNPRVSSFTELRKEFRTDLSSLASSILMIFGLGSFGKVVLSNTLRYVAAMKYFFGGPVSVSEKPSSVMGHSLFSFGPKMTVSALISPPANPKPTMFRFIDVVPKSFSEMFHLVHGVIVPLRSIA